MNALLRLQPRASMDSIANFLVDAFVVLGVVWPYYPQARQILHTRNADAFSTRVSLIIVVSATLRIFFWLGKRFETALLVQAIASMMTQLAMMAVVTRVNRSRRSIASATSPGSAARPRFRSFLDLNPSDFWAWDDAFSYIQFEIVLLGALTLLHSAFGHLGWYVELLGTLSLGIEALLPLPQALQNYRNKSTHGLSAILIFSWVLGDAFKTGYAVQKGAPLQFIACGLFQLTVDLLILYQMQIQYKHARPPISSSASASSLSKRAATDGTSISPPRSSSPPGPIATWANIVKADAQAELDRAAHSSHTHAHKHHSHGTS